MKPDQNKPRTPSLERRSFQRKIFARTSGLAVALVALAGCTTYDPSYSTLLPSGPDTRSPNEIVGMWSRKSDPAGLQDHTRALLFHSNGTGQWYNNAMIHFEGHKERSGPTTWSYSGSGIWRVSDIHQCSEVRARLSTDGSKLLLECRFFDGTRKHWVFDRVQQANQQGP
jgi:hypothetical protein